MSQTTSQVTGRSAVFLEEMGIGPLWSPRRLTAAPQAAAPAEVELAEVEPAEAEPAPPQVHLVPAVAAVAEPAPALADEAVPARVRFALAPEPEPEAQQTPVAPPAAAATAVAAGDDSSTAWFDDAPAPVAAAAVTAEQIALMGWDELKTAIAKCTRCALCRTRKTVVSARGTQRAGMAVVGRMPGRADEKSGQALSGDAGKLLDNMLLAIELTPERDVYVTNLLKCRALDAAGAERAATADEVAACAPFLQRELALSGAGTVLGLGSVAVQGVLSTLGEADTRAVRGTVHRAGPLAVVATFHPEDLLQQGANKARAWADLCLARVAHAEPR
jgi:DNA polymerase